LTAKQVARFVLTVVNSKAYLRQEGQVVVKEHPGFNNTSARRRKMKIPNSHAPQNINFRQTPFKRNDQLVLSYLTALRPSIALDTPIDRSGDLQIVIE
jgi:hypothetical protein